MSGIPSVLGLGAEEAARRLAAAGFPQVRAAVSGRRRVGVLRVIRQVERDGLVELTAAHFRELDWNRARTEK